MFYAPCPAPRTASLPQWIPLWRRKQLDALLHGEVPRQDDINNLYVPGWGGNPIAEKTLYHLPGPHWKRHWMGLNSVFSPDGLLHRLNLGAIPDEQGRMGERASNWYASTVPASW